jgi:hypothetical protein
MIEKKNITQTYKVICTKKMRVRVKIFEIFLQLFLITV